MTPGVVAFPGAAESAAKPAATDNVNDQDREDTFLLNAALGTDLLTSYVAATDDEPPPKSHGCLVCAVGVLLAWVLWLCLWLASIAESIAAASCGGSQDSTGGLPLAGERQSY